MVNHGRQPLFWAHRQKGKPCLTPNETGQEVDTWKRATDLASHLPADYSIRRSCIVLAQLNCLTFTTKLAIEGSSFMWDEGSSYRVRAQQSKESIIVFKEADIIAFQVIIKANLENPRRLKVTNISMLRRLSSGYRLCLLNY